MHPSVFRHRGWLDNAPIVFLEAANCTLQQKKKKKTARGVIKSIHSPPLFPPFFANSVTSGYRGVGPWDIAHFQAWVVGFEKYLHQFFCEKPPWKSYSSAKNAPWGFEQICVLEGEENRKDLIRTGKWSSWPKAYMFRIRIKNASLVRILKLFAKKKSYSIIF